MKRPPAPHEIVPFEDAELPQGCSYPAFAPIISDAFERFTGMPASSIVAKGVVLIQQDLPTESVYLIRDGLVKLTHISANGRESIIGLRAPGWYGGAVSAMSQKPSVYTVRTVTPTIVSQIPAADFPLWLMQSFKRAHHFTQTLCNELLSQSAKAQVIGASAPERLTHYMRERTSRHPQLKTLDTLPLLKRVELAQLLAITPEHLSRLLHKDIYRPQP
jgi:CRP/FNR family transcriptional regulator